MQNSFHKHKLLLDENMPERHAFPLLNDLFDVKHVRDDLHRGGLSDPQVYALAAKQHRLLVTYNSKDFKPFAARSLATGVIGVSATLPVHQQDRKLTALLVHRSAKALLGKFTALTGETKAA